MFKKFKNFSPTLTHLTPEIFVSNICFVQQIDATLFSVIDKRQYDLRRHGIRRRRLEYHAKQIGY